MDADTLTTADFPKGCTIAAEPNALGIRAPGVACPEGALQIAGDPCEKPLGAALSGRVTLTSLTERVALGYEGAAFQAASIGFLEQLSGGSELLQAALALGKALSLQREVTCFKVKQKPNCAGDWLLII